MALEATGLKPPPTLLRIHSPQVPDTQARGLLLTADWSVVEPCTWCPLLEEYRSNK